MKVPPAKMWLSGPGYKNDPGKKVNPHSCEALGSACDMMHGFECDVMDRTHRVARYKQNKALYGFYM